MTFRCCLMLMKIYIRLHRNNVFTAKRMIEKCSRTCCNFLDTIDYWNSCLINEQNRVRLLCRFVAHSFIKRLFFLTFFRSTFTMIPFCLLIISAEISMHFALFSQAFCAILVLKLNSCSFEIMSIWKVIWHFWKMFVSKTFFKTF